MNAAAGEGISEDGRQHKTLALDWVEDWLKFQTGDEVGFNPPINRKQKKSLSRGWNHIDLARFLCPPSHLEQYDKDPER